MLCFWNDADFGEVADLQVVQSLGSEICESFRGLSFSAWVKHWKMQRIPLAKQSGRNNSYWRFTLGPVVSCNVGKAIVNHRPKITSFFIDGINYSQVGGFAILFCPQYTLWASISTTINTSYCTIKWTYVSANLLQDQRAAAKEVAAGCHCYNLLQSFAPY